MRDCDLGHPQAELLADSGLLHHAFVDGAKISREQWLATYDKVAVLPTGTATGSCSDCRTIRCSLKRSHRHQALIAHPVTLLPEGEMAVYTVRLLCLRVKRQPILSRYCLRVKWQPILSGCCA